jgi:Zn-dependent dipeptidase, microsomal dipeptidase homolog
MRALLSRVFLGFGCGVLSAGAVLAASDESLEARARAIHERVMTIDTHVDIPLDFATSEFMPGSAEAQVNLDTMESGGLNAAFFIVYVGQTERTEEGYRQAKADALAKFDAIHRMTDFLYSDRIGLATTAAEARALHDAGKLVAFIGMENGYVIGQDLSLLAEYRARGARYLTLVHNGHNDIGDSAQPQARLNDVPSEHDGLSAFGYQVVEELNRLGILVDVSHVAKSTMLDATRHSKAPVIASHSSARALYDHPRNMDDEQLLALKENGGVIQIVAFNSYLKPAGETATVEDLVDHIDYVVKLIGIDHVGISSDFGGGGGISGWNGAAETFNVTLELVRRGYSEEDIAKLWGGNVLRILDEAERVAAAP